MIRPAATATPKPKSLAEQESDFTSEGSPPPGTAATPDPVTSDKTAKRLPRATATAPIVHEAPRVGKDRDAP